MIAKRSLHWILLPLVIAIILLIVSLIMLKLLIVLVILFLLISIFFSIFFRDPERSVGEGIVAPADGKISSIQYRSEELRISTLMSLFDVHVNRAPIEGKVLKIEHIPGKHVPAASKDSEANERSIITLDTKIGQVRIFQIAGAFARRIVTYISENDKLIKGQRIGIIRFGSRLDLYLPKNRAKIVVKSGENVKAGTSCLAEVVNHEK